MKKLKFLFSFLMVIAMTLLFNACSDDDNPGTDPTPNPDPVLTDFHFDVFVTIGSHGGMSTTKHSIAKSVTSLTSDAGVINIKGSGIELNKYTLESIVKGQYYYQVTSDDKDFCKFQIQGNSIKEIQRQPFVTNVYKSRGYTHAWLDDNTLLILSANGKADKIIWTKLNAKDMSIIKEGTLDLPLPAVDKGTTVFNATGILTYSPKNGTLYYFYFGKTKSGRGGKATTNFWVATINPQTMAVESNIENTRAAEMAGSAYGELLQSCVMYDEAGNLYLAAFTDEDNIEKGHLLRIKKGAKDFDNYEGYPDADGKLLTIQYLGGNKALIYARNDTKGTSIDDYSHYYAILDLTTGIRERLSYDGKEIAYSGGRFSQRTAIVNGKAYIGVNTQEDTNAVIYIYDIKTGKIEKGAEVDGGYYFDILRVVENDK